MCLRLTESNNLVDTALGNLLKVPSFFSATDLPRALSRERAKEREREREILMAFIQMRLARTDQTRGLDVEILISTK